MKDKDIKNKTVALIMTSKDEKGQDDWVVVKGMVKRIGKSTYFIPEGKRKGFPIPEDSLDRMTPTNCETRKILLDADISLSLTVGPKPKGVDVDEFVPTGLKWPKKKK